MIQRYTILCFFTIVLNVLTSGCTIIDSTELKMEKKYSPLVVTRGGVDTVKLGKKIQNAIKNEQSIKPYSLDVNIRQEEVILNGFVADLEDKNRIESIVSNNTDLKLVSNLRITPVTDRVILKERITQGLLQEGVNSDNDLEILVDEGVATIKGVRGTHEEIDKILAITLNIEGVKDVKSEMKIGSVVNQNLIKDSGTQELVKDGERY